MKLSAAITRKEEEKIQEITTKTKKHHEKNRKKGLLMLLDLTQTNKIGFYIQKRIVIGAKVIWFGAL